METAALITGATSGFGLEFARIFAEHKSNVVLVARSLNILEQTKKELQSKYGIKVFILEKDLSKPSAADEVFDFTNRNGLEIDTLINNAGFGDWASFTHSDITRLENMVNLNNLTVLKLCRLYAPLMEQKKHGYILNVSSIAGFAPGPFMATYYASKAFILSLSQALHEELKPSKVYVSALCPGPANTGFVKLANLEGTSFSKTFSHTSPKFVAEYGYKKLLKNKAVIIPGFATKFLEAGIKIMPTRFIRQMIYKIQEN